MCKNLVAKGDLKFPLIIYNRTQKRSHDLQASLPPGKTVVASTVEEAVSKANIIFTCVGDDAAINETIDTALKGDVNGKLFVDCSTIHPETSEGLAKRLSAAGAEFVAGPVFGPPAAADAGQCKIAHQNVHHRTDSDNFITVICLLAGPASSVAKVAPYTKGVLGKALIDFSDQPVTKALQLKVIGNTFILNMIESLSEGLVLAEKSGLGTDNLVKFIELLFPGPYVAYAGRMTSGDYHTREEPLFTVDLARKDARHALALAKEHGTKLKDVEVADGHLVSVKEKMGERGDIASIYGAVRQEAGLKFEND